MHYYLVILLDAFCVYHIWKKRTENYWFYVVLLMPVVGALVYIATQVLKKDTLTELQDGLTQVVNPNLKIQKLEQQLAFSDTFQNRIALADAFLEAKMYTEALEYYEYCLKGPFSNDSHLNIQLCIAYFGNHNYHKVIEFASIVSNLKEFDLSQAPLFQALAFEQLNRLQEAEKVFEKYNRAYSNYEIRYHFIQFLKRQNRNTESQELANAILTEFERMNRKEKGSNKNWESLIKKSLIN